MASSASCILSAAKQGDRKSVQGYITDRQVNIVDEEGCTPLMVAAANGRDEIIRLLLEQEVSDIININNVKTVINFEVILTTVCNFLN
jgi:ankyrin repeat protein